MPRRNPSLAVSLVSTLFTLTIPALAAELQVGKAQQGTVAAGKTDSYMLPLRSGDYAEVNVQGRGAALLVIAYGPSGAKLRGFKLGPEGQKVRFISESAGEHRIDLSAVDKTKDAPYTLTLTKVLSLDERVRGTAAVPLECPEIKTLRGALQAGGSGETAKFWEMVKARGAPLIDPLDGDDKRMLVTFLWKGSPDTRDVTVIWFPYTARWPDDYRLERLGSTDIWYRTVKVDRRKRFMYRLAANAPPVRVTEEPPAGDDTFSTIFAAAQNDPLNPKRWLEDPEDPDPPQYNGWSAVEMPGAPPQPWIARREGVPQGEIQKRRIASALLKNEREVAVYTPPGYGKESKPYPLVVLFDEKSYLRAVPTPVILDNLIAEKRIPPVVAVLLDNPPGARSRELPCNTAFADFLNFELVPWIRRSYNVTTDASRTVVGGSSYGGLAAAYAGLRHSETFGNVLSQSGSYWWTPPRTDNPSDFDANAEPNWVARQFIASSRLPVRFYLDAGSDELDFSGHGSAILEPNRRLRDVLLAKGYEVHYQEFNGGHDYMSWRGTLADGLILLLGSRDMQHAAARALPSAK